MPNKKITKRKKIMVISALDLWSLGEKIGAQSLWKTLEGYAKEGWDVYFITSNKDKREKTNFDHPDLLDSLHITRFEIPFFHNFFNIKGLDFLSRNLEWDYFQLVATFKGINIAKREKIDVYYGYEVHGVVAAKLLSLLFRKPLISRFQGTLLSKYLDRDNQLWKIKYWWHILAFKTKTNLLIMANDGTRGDTILKNLGVNMSKVKFWINGVDRFSKDDQENIDNLRTKLNMSPEEKVLLSVSRLERWKRIDRTIDALPLVLKKFPKLKFLIVGDGSQRKSLEALVKKFGVSEAVVFIGGVPHNELGSYYCLADIFVSMYDLSNVGNPLFEAMASEKCAVVYDVGDTSKIIKNKENGVLVSDPSPKKLAKTLISLLENDQKRSDLGYKARVYAEKNIPSWKDRMKAELSEVEKLLK